MYETTALIAKNMINVRGFWDTLCLDKPILPPIFFDRFHEILQQMGVSHQSIPSRNLWFSPGPIQKLAHLKGGILI